MQPHPYDGVQSPAYILEAGLLRRNLDLVASVAAAADVHIILALKAFAMWRAFPTIGASLHGATASSLNEARLIYEEMGVKAHTYCVAYRPDEFEEIMRYSSHIVFNSVAQYERFIPLVAAAGAGISCGIRINPEYSVTETDLYNPAVPGSRLGETLTRLQAAFPDGLPANVEGLHFHTLCEGTAADLKATLAAVEARFGAYLSQLKWINMGGGHLMTHPDYDTELLIATLRDFKDRHGIDVILEPGSAIVYRTGPLLATVLDIHHSGDIATAILDVSFTAHMPDTLEMPYRPVIRGSVPAEAGLYAYRMGGVSCLAGDYLEAYHFAAPLQVGDTLLLEDMNHYTTVKTTMFNGVRHPDLCLQHEDGRVEVLRRFDYNDYRNRMA